MIRLRECQGVDCYRPRACRGIGAGNLTRGKAGVGRCLVLSVGPIVPTVRFETIVAAFPPCRFYWIGSCPRTRST